MIGRISLHETLQEVLGQHELVFSPGFGKIKRVQATLHENLEALEVSLASPRYFLGFTQALAFPVGNNGSYTLLEGISIYMVLPTMLYGCETVMKRHESRLQTEMAYLRRVEGVTSLIE